MVESMVIEKKTVRIDLTCLTRKPLTYTISARGKPMVPRWTKLALLYHKTSNHLCGFNLKSGSSATLVKDELIRSIHFLAIRF
jgi:hypothetical protein